VVQRSPTRLLHPSSVMQPIPGSAKVAHREENIVEAELELNDEGWKEIEAAAG
jgi:aryl-alcohol dehydrogenase-like predicted oxidoreductase